MRFEIPLASRSICCAFALLAVVQWIPVPAHGADYPPLQVEISAEHPLMLFQDSPAHRSNPEMQREQILGAWAQVPASIQSHAVFKLHAPGQAASMKDHYDQVLSAFQEPLIPTVIQIADDPQRERFDPALLEGLLGAYTMVRGIEVAGLDFRFYDSPRMMDGQTPVVITWLESIIETAARYGRFVYIPMNEVQWARVMSNRACEPLYRKIVACRDYVIPAVLTRGDHVISNQSAVLGLWLEGAVGHWGMAADARWYTDNHYVRPGEFGYSEGDGATPPSLYRAMILSGAMTGATVYAFENGNDLWYGAARHHWDESIFPTLREILSKRVVARQDKVADRARVALQLAPARNPEDFHVNLKDIDGVLDEGNLLRAAYGLERPGQIAELIPNRGDYYWIPFISPYASGAVQNGFDRVVPAGALSSAPAWIEALAPYREQAGAGTAFQTRVGFGIFVMNSRENVRERQSYTIEQVPPPVRAFKATRDGASVILDWDVRENDLGYRIYKRVFPETRWEDLDAVSADFHRYVDANAPAGQKIAYAVTAQAWAEESMSGTLDYGEYLVFSTTESRIVEEVVLTDLVANAISGPVLEPLRNLEVTESWWPSLDNVPVEHQETAEAIVEQIELWEGALAARSLNGVMGIYGTDYEDPQRRDFHYVQRAYQHMLERWRGIKMHRQIRRWDFSNFASTGRVDVLLYCRLTGLTLTDTLGLRADIPVSIPRTDEAEVWVKWGNAEGVWRIVQTNPALPNFREILSYDAGPYDNFPLGPDQY